MRTNALSVLSHLILNDMIRVKGQIAWIVVLLEDPDPIERQSGMIAKSVGCARLSLIPVCSIGRFSVGWFAKHWICHSMTGVCWALAAQCH